MYFDHVPRRATQEHMRSLFEKAGPVEELKLLQPHGRGWCRLASSAAATRAARQLSGVYVLGRTMYVSRSPPAWAANPEVDALEVAAKPDAAPGPQGEWLGTCRVTFRNSAERTTEGFLRSKFEAVERVAAFELQRRPDGRSLGRGTCEYYSAAAARRAVSQLDGRVVDGNQLTVILDHNPGADPASKVFFHNVDWLVTQATLRNIFEEVGPVRKFELRIKWDGRSLGMGTCEYECPDDAMQALRRLGGTKVHGRPIYVSAYGTAGRWPIHEPPTDLPAFGASDMPCAPAAATIDGRQYAVSSSSGASSSSSGPTGHGRSHRCSGSHGQTRKPSLNKGQAVQGQPTAPQQWQRPPACAGKSAREGTQRGRAGGSGGVVVNACPRPDTAPAQRRLAEAGHDTRRGGGGLMSRRTR